MNSRELKFAALKAQIMKEGPVSRASPAAASFLHN